jgi:hypothetical protein
VLLTGMLVREVTPRLRSRAAMVGFCVGLLLAGAGRNLVRRCRHSIAGIALAPIRLGGALDPVCAPALRARAQKSMK